MVEGLTSLEVAAKRLTSVNSLIPIPGVTGAQSVCTISTPTTSFCLGSSTQCIIATTIQVMGSKYLATLKKAFLNVVEVKIQKAPMIYMR